MINPKKITTRLFSFSMVLLLIGYILKLMDYKEFEQFLILGGLVYLIFVFYCLYEIWSSKKFLLSEKIIWVIFLFLVPFITGLVYLIYVRKKTA